MPGITDFITGSSARKQASATAAMTDIAKEQAELGREQWGEYRKDLYPGEKAFIQETMGYDPNEISRYSAAQDEIAQIEARGNALVNPATQGGLRRKEYDEEGSLRPDRYRYGDDQPAARPVAAGLSPQDQARLQQLRSIPRPTSRRPGIDAETKQGLQRLDELAKGDPAIAAELQGLHGMSDSPVSAQDYLDASRENIDYWNTDPAVLTMESQRAAETAQQEADAQQQAERERLFAYGVNPASGVFAGAQRRGGLEASGNRISAINAAIRGARDAEYGRKVDAYGRRVQGMGLANDTALGNFTRKAGLLDTRRAMGMDDFNRGLQSFSTRQGARLTDFNKRMAAVGLGKGVGTQGVQLLGQGQVGLSNAANAYGNMADRSSGMVSDLIGAGIKGYGLSKMKIPGVA